MIRRKITWMFLVAVLSVLLPAFVVQGLAQGSPAAATSENDGGKCSLATLKGSYGVLEQGTVVGQIPGFSSSALAGRQQRARYLRRCRKRFGRLHGEFWRCDRAGDIRRYIQCKA